jgi:tetratricopeptide (TPR) repeat protein
MIERGFFKISVLWIIVLNLLQVTCTHQSKKRIVFTPEDFSSKIKEVIGSRNPVISFNFATDKKEEDIPYQFTTILTRPPYSLDKTIKNQVKTCLTDVKSEAKRLKVLQDCILKTPSAIIYNSRYTFDATKCYYLRKGNCFSLINLFLGAARYSGFKAYYMLVEDTFTADSSRGIVVHANHIICGTRVNGRIITVDFLPEHKEYRIITILSDIEATGLFYNNLAVEYLIAGDNKQAMFLFRIAEHLFPDSYQINNNIGALLLRKNEFEAAELYFKKALKQTKFPDLIYGNLLSIMRKRRDPIVMEALEKQFEFIKRRNPYFYISLATDAYNQKKVDQAITYLNMARKINKRIPQIYNLLSKIYQSKNKPEKSRRAFKKMKKYTLQGK